MPSGDQGCPLVRRKDEAPQQAQLRLGSETIFRRTKGEGMDGAGPTGDEGGLGWIEGPKPKVLAQDSRVNLGPDAEA